MLESDDSWRSSSSELHHLTAVGASDWSDQTSYLSSPLPLLQVEGGQQLYTCALRPTGIYGEGHELMKSFYDEAVKRGGVVIGGVPPNSEHGRVYAGDKHNAAAALMGRRVTPHYLSL